MKTIYFLTGPKNSGKSTRLLNWSKKQKNIIGIICPRDSGKRELYSILSNETRMLEAEDKNQEILQIGQYNFLAESFRWAENELMKSVEIIPKWIVIDEIGPLELLSKGFYKATKNLIDNPELIETNLMLVVRDTLVEDIIKFFSLNKKDVQIVDFI